MYGWEYARIQLGLSMKDLADELGVSQQFISMCVKGKKKISQDRAAKLETLFSVPREILLKEIAEEDEYQIIRMLRKGEEKKVKQEQYDEKKNEFFDNYAEQLVRMMNILDGIEEEFHRRFQEKNDEKLISEMIKRIDLLEEMAEIFKCDVKMLEKFSLYIDEIKQEM